MVVGIVHALHVENVHGVHKVFTNLKLLDLVHDAFPSTGTIMCDVHTLRSGQDIVMPDPHKRIHHAFTASSTLCELIFFGHGWSQIATQRRCPGSQSTRTHRTRITLGTYMPMCGPNCDRALVTVIRRIRPLIARIRGEPHTHHAASPEVPSRPTYPPLSNGVPLKPERALRCRTHICIRAHL